MNSVVVVGNKFREFGANDGVLTMDQFDELVEKGALTDVPLGTTFVAGQGLREADAIKLGVANARAATSNHRKDETFSARLIRASRLLTHKHQLRNSIISTPELLREDLYEAALLLDERSELMCDHQTGQHIQGMVLIEAARQMFLAVTEQHFIGHDDPNRYYFVIHGLDVAFSGFVFPVEATLRYEILEKRTVNRERMYFKVSVSVMQAGKCATTVAFEFTAFLSEKIERKEREQAVSALDHVRKAIELRTATEAQRETTNRLRSDTVAQ